MSEFTIEDSDLAGVKDAVVIVTGSSSGIGLATTKLLLEKGAKVVGGDLEPSKEPLDHADFSFVRTDVTSWKDQVELFKAAVTKHGHVNHVFANAGIGRANEYLEDKFDDAGDLVEPNHVVLDVNLTGVLNTIKLGIHHMKKGDKTGSIVATASGAGLIPFDVVDYCASKFAVIGVIRSLARQLHPELPIRINGLAPSWTDTRILPPDFQKRTGHTPQSPDHVARQTVLLMSDDKRHNQVIFSTDGKCWEVNEELMKRTAEVVSFGEPTPNHGI